MATQNNSGNSGNPGNQRDDQNRDYNSENQRDNQHTGRRDLTEDQSSENRNSGRQQDGYNTQSSDPSESDYSAASGQTRNPSNQSGNDWNEDESGTSPERYASGINPDSDDITQTDTESYNAAKRSSSYDEDVEDELRARDNSERDDLSEEDRRNPRSREDDGFGNL
jgi:hypothetical protein